MNQEPNVAIDEVRRINLVQEVKQKKPNRHERRKVARLLRQVKPQSVAQRAIALIKG